MSFLPNVNLHKPKCILYVKGLLDVMLTWKKRFSTDPYHVEVESFKIGRTDYDLSRFIKLKSSWRAFNLFINPDSCWNKIQIKKSELFSRSKQIVA